MGQAPEIERTTVPTRVVTVVAADDVAPGLRQLTFGGLAGHEPIGPDDFFLVIRPAPGEERMLDDGTTFAEYCELPPARAPQWAYYTCRRWRPESGELDMWFVLHDHGAISGWARDARPGDRVALWGPRASFDPPPTTTSLLLVGDETGLGAFAAIVETTGPSMPVTALLESDDGTPTVDLVARPAVTTRWIGRDGAERGTGTGLLDAVTRLAPDVEGLYVYGAGESRLVSTIRRHLRDERGMTEDQVQMIGYWRRRA